MYSLKASLCNKRVHLLANDRAMPKCKRRQMASMSVRNLMSHIAAISYAHFHPSSDNYFPPRNLTEGAKDFINMLKKLAWI